MTNNNNTTDKGNTMATIDFEHGLTENVDAEDAHNTTWSECKCEACTSNEHNDGANGYENHVGDGPSGFDFYQDTKWTC